MAVLPLVIAPDPRLETVSTPVEEITDEIRAFSDDLLETMYASGGIGLAAVQVGVLKRIIAVDTDQREEGKPGNPMILINPEIDEASEELNVYNEGCLSFPDQYSNVERPKTVKIHFTDLEGNKQTLEADGLLATCVQHEIDHINGVVFVDHISKLKRDMILRKLKKAKKLGQLEFASDNAPVEIK